MAKATIEYNLDEHGDQMAFNRAMKSTDMAFVLFELTTNLRKKLREMDELDYETSSFIFKQIRELMEDHSINIDELID